MTNKGKLVIKSSLFWNDLFLLPVFSKIIESNYDSEQHGILKKCNSKTVLTVSVYFNLHDYIR